MKATYEFDIDPRYGWVHIKTEGRKNFLIIIEDADGLTQGFTLSEEGRMEPSCICNAWHEGECSCRNVAWQG